MKILIIGDHPDNIGGVVNYTRPLAEELSKMGNKVTYFCTGSFNNNYNLFLKPYLKKQNKTNYDLYELINCPNFSFNYDNLERDLNSKIVDNLVEKLILEVKPDVIHIHEMMGLSLSTLKKIKEYNIPLFRTIHVYWHLCPKRVMINSTGELCEGPENISECAKCIDRVKYNNSISKILIKKYFKVPKFVKTIKLNQRKKTIKKTEINRIDFENNKGTSSLNLEGLLDRRLNENINILNNYFDKVICVSNDVKNTLKRFGVREENLLVQHIGSTIAEKQEINLNNVGEKVVFANIGGVNHYKGSEVLVNAFNEIDPSKYELKVFGWYQQEYLDKITQDKNINATFYGKYSPDSLKDLLKDIDVMILPSICKDTAPQTIFEAFSCGIPIIASNAGGFPDFVENNVNGLLFEQGNHVELKKCINKIIDDKALINKYKDNIPNLKTISQNAHELTEIYNNYIKISK